MTGRLNATLRTPTVDLDSGGAAWQSAACDVFIDLSAAGSNRGSLDDYLNQLVRDASLAGVADHVTLASSADSEPPIVRLDVRLAADPAQPATVLLARAISRAAALRHHLIVLLGAVIPDAEVLSLLIEAVDRDPMFGIAQPRFAQDGTNSIWPLPGRADREWAGPSTSHTVLPFLPETTITPELLAACLLLRWDALAAADAVDHGYASAAGALLQLLCQARRRGMRNVVVNRAVVPSQLTYRALYPIPPHDDLDRLRTVYPDNALAEAQIAGLMQRGLEPLLVAAHSASLRRILLDCRGMTPEHNGTAQCILGVLDGFTALDRPGLIDVLVSRETSTFHSLAERYPSFRTLDHPAGEYFAAVCLTHPWSFSTVAELHRHSLMIAFNMLDTIGWDVLYTNGAFTVEAVWRFIARHADGLLYISNFTRERFKVRFPIAPGILEQVTHLSLLQDEHVYSAARGEPVSDYILVFGNNYDHKDVRPTSQVLVHAFPFNRIVAFGIDEAPGPNVVAIPSGRIGQEALHRLLAGARVIVFPSFYEGFGLPVVEGLAYGRPVVVRRSPLWAEIAGWSRLPGDLIEFDDAPSLVEAVGRVLAGLPSRTLPSGVELANGTHPAGWRECAGRIIALLDDCLAYADGSRWREREEALRVAGL